MLNLTDLGIAPAESASTLTDAETLTNDRAGLVPGSMLARTLFQVWDGQRVTIVDSPPGAGKTTLVVDLLDNLVKRSDLKVVVACPTRRGAADLAGRLAQQFGTDKDAPRVVLDIRNVELPEGVHRSGGVAARNVIVKTVASCAMSRSGVECDLMVFDEAYQTTFAQAAAAANNAAQVLMVGDPGQIGPVVTTKTAAWSRMKAAPFMRAPEVFVQRTGSSVLQMDCTYRIGQATVDAIAPLYGFPFTSKRPDRVLRDRDGSAMPELASLRVAAPERGIGDVPTMRAVAEAAYAMVGRVVETTEADGTITQHRLRETDVAVVVAHNVQASAVEAALDGMAMGNVTVGTADKLQGGQWHAVIALDPTIGHGHVGAHQLSPGRLCVMASRHMTHLTWVHDGSWEPMLRAAVEDGTPRDAADAGRGLAVRYALTGTNPADVAPAPVADEGNDFWAA